MTMRLDISLGPVQGFIAQSRRTRDIWGSSYLLSFLSGHAMLGATEACGQVTQPLVDDNPLYRWIRRKGSGKPPGIGTLPNHFVVEVEAGGDARAIADAAKSAVNTAWHCLSQAVWKGYVHRASTAGRGTKQIWSRQIDGFWEFAWTLDPAGDSGLLGRRKHWRSHRLPDEPGDKCTVMPDWQELSGHIRSRGAKSQDRFWQRLRSIVGSLDIRENERLCAIALIKRLFPKLGDLAKEDLGLTSDAVHWPSTVYIGAVPWIREAVDVAPKEARQFADAVRKHAPDAVSEWQSPIQGFDGQLAGSFPNLDANYFHRERVDDERLCPISEDADDNIRKKLAESLQAIYDARKRNGIQLGSPSSFYALLLADGDRLGKLVAERRVEGVGEALAGFTKGVRKIVEDHWGVTIYAGGDDVMAMLPVPMALSCSEALAQSYRMAFEGQPGATLSAAVLFAHVRSPLSTVCATAHRLLDEVAKDGNGRDSLAAAVLNPGGLACEWVTTWKRLDSDDRQSSAVCLLNELVGRLKSDAAEPGLSSALIYRIREMLSVLCGWARWKPGAWGALPEGLDIHAFLHAEVFHSLTVRIGEGAEGRATKLANLLRRLLGRSRSSSGERDSGTDSSQGSDAWHTNSRNSEAGIDALLLARFLTTSGHERDL